MFRDTRRVIAYGVVEMVMMVDVTDGTAETWVVSRSSSNNQKNSKKNTPTLVRP